jgi:hypothetical protein
VPIPWPLTHVAVMMKKMLQPASRIRLGESRRLPSERLMPIRLFSDAVVVPAISPLTALELALSAETIQQAGYFS